MQVSYHEALAKVVLDESPPRRGGGGFRHRAQGAGHRAEERYTACSTRKLRDGRKVEQNGSPPAPLSGGLGVGSWFKQLVIN